MSSTFRQIHDLKDGEDDIYIQSELRAINLTSRSHSIKIPVMKIEVYVVPGYGDRDLIGTDLSCQGSAYIEYSPVNRGEKVGVSLSYQTLDDDFQVIDEK